MSVFFRPRPTRAEPEDLRRRLQAALDERWPNASFAVRLEGRDPVVAWHDGPAPSAVAGLVGGLVNWEVRGARTPPERPGAPAVLLDRNLSDAALAVAVVRYAGSHPRPYGSDRPQAVADLGQLLDVDDPARSGYPVVDRMAELLLERRPPDTAGPDASPADRLADALTALGYDALWAIAWKELP